MRPTAAMHISDRIVYSTLRGLLDECGEQAVLTQPRIAQAAELSLRATQYSLKRLMDEGRIEGKFTIGVGYRYSLKGHAK